MCVGAWFLSGAWLFRAWGRGYVSARAWPWGGGGALLVWEVAF